MRLLEPAALGALALPNRVVMAPMTRSRAVAGKCPGPQTARYYAQRAGAGLIVSEGTHILAETSHSERSPGIYTPAQVTAWSEVAREVHAAGGRMFLQLWHLGRAWHGAPGQPPVGPSAVAARVERPDAQGVVRGLPVPRAIDQRDIAVLVQAYRAAARNAMAAGMDGVEVHAANGYLIDQFLRDGSNRRSDGYGGSALRRSRFLLEVVEAVCDAVGAERTGVRLSPCKTFNDMFDSDPLATFSTSIDALDRFGLAYLHLASEAPGSPGLVPDAESLTDSLGERFSGPVILNGGYTAARAEHDLARGLADLVSFGTLFIANPDLVHRLRTGAAFNPLDRERISGGGAAGYTDYPALPSGR